MVREVDVKFEASNFVKPLATVAGELKKLMSSPTCESKNVHY